MIRLNPDDYSKLVELINEKDNVELEVAYNKMFNTLWLSGPFETELYLKSGYKKDLIISRICLTNRHSGIGTQILDWLINYAKEKGFLGITVESVITQAMDNFCNKHNFTRVEHSGTECNNIWHGNYYLKLED